MTDFLGPKSSKKYFCKECDYSTCKKSQYDRHLLTSKHQMDDKWMTEKAQKAQNLFECSCGKRYKYRQGLHKHQLKCISIAHTENIENAEDIDYKEMFLKMMKQNNELMTQVTGLIPKVGNNNNNTIKQKFNVNIFLNEECKDAITMNEFIKQIEVSLGNLLTTRDKGISEGVSDIFIENMNKLSVYERPIHCTDIKRETMYIKDEDKWQKDQNSVKLENAIQEVSRKSMNKLSTWKETNPDYEDMDSEFSIKFNFQHFTKKLESK